MPGSFTPPVRVAIVTLDHHLKGAVERADGELGPDNIHLTLHAASDWDRDAAALEGTRQAIAEADIVIATMLFLDDHVRAILPALEARREQCDAMLGLMSAGEVVKLTRLGNYRMDAPARGPLAMLKRLRGSKQQGATSGAGQMKMLRRLPKILRFIPGTAQDVRAYFLTLQYWLAGSDAIYDALFRRYGVYRADTTEEMVEIAYACQFGRYAAGRCGRTDARTHPRVRLDACTPRRPGHVGRAGRPGARRGRVALAA